MYLEKALSEAILIVFITFGLIIASDSSSAPPFSHSSGSGTSPSSTSGSKPKSRVLVPREGRRRRKRGKNEIQRK